MSVAVAFVRRVVHRATKGAVLRGAGFVVASATQCQPFAARRFLCACAPDEGPLANAVSRVLWERRFGTRFVKTRLASTRARVYCVCALMCVVREAGRA